MAQVPSQISPPSAHGPSSGRTPSNHPSGQHAGNHARQPIIRLRNLHKAFGSLKVLAGVDLDIPEGMTTVVLGPSGSGKSVMLKHIIGLLQPDAGEIYFDGARIDNLRERDLTDVRLQVGLLFQGGALFDSLSVEENIEFPLREHTRLTREERHERVAQALEVVDLKGMFHKLPSQLSGGQRKRVALARAIVLQPRVVLYDEPTTGLDPIRSDGINELIIKLKKTLGVTSIVVTHDLVSARKVSDRCVMLLHGKIAADGTYDELARHDNPQVSHFFMGQYDHEDEKD